MTIINLDGKNMVALGDSLESEFRKMRNEIINTQTLSEDEEKLRLSIFISSLVYVLAECCAVVDEEGVESLVSKLKLLIAKSKDEFSKFYDVQGCA